MHDDIYDKALSQLLAKGWINKDSSILVVCGGDMDRACLLAQGFTNVTISNLDVRMDGDDQRYAPYAWQLQDAENLTYADNSFDWVIEHWGLHHCASPHRALTEMCRVAGGGVLVMESRDSWLMRAGKKLGLTGDYEIGAVVAHGMKFGGLRNTSIPNYVYRWTEREVEKTVNSYFPHFQNDIAFFYHLLAPIHRLKTSPRLLPRLLAPLVGTALKVFVLLFPRQGNQFGFAFRKGARLQPWISREGERYVAKREYFAARYPWLGGQDD